MPKFSTGSFSKLSSCHIDLQAVFYEVVKTFDCTIICGHRNQYDQDVAYDAGNSKVRWPAGKHNQMPSLAVDVCAYPIQWRNIKRHYWFAGYAMGIAQRLKEEGKITHAIKFGGDWDQDKDIDDQDFKDLVHFEIVL